MAAEQRCLPKPGELLFCWEYARMKQTLNANHLKLMAILAMTVDHLADLMYPGFPCQPLPLGLHLLGRLTAPIMWFFICEGYHYTRNLGKYLLRLFCFAVVSHFAYCFAFGISFVPFSGGFLNQTSVMWPLFWSVVALWVLNDGRNLKQWHKWGLLLLICLITFPADWSCIAVMAVVFLYEHRGNLKKQMGSILFWVLVYALVSFFFVSKTYALAQLGVILVYPVLKRYNGQKGQATWMKWFFYGYYPAHLLLIGLLRLMLYGNISLLF